MKWLVTSEAVGEEWFETREAATMRINELMAQAVQYEIDHGKVADWDIALLEVRGQGGYTSN